IGNLGRRAVARENNLFMPVEKGVEGVKKFLLRALLAAEKLNVVDQEEVCLSIAFAKLNQVVVLNCVDKFVDKKFARKVHDLCIFLFHPNVLTDRLHQVCLAKSDPAVIKAGVIRWCRRLCSSRTRPMRNLFIRSDDKCFELVPGVKP